MDELENGYKKLANDPEELAIAYRREVVRKQREALREMDKVQMALENEAAIQRVRELHKPIDDDGLPPVNVRCQECGYYDYWPCATIQALDGEQ